MVSDEVTDDIFENYKINYNMITESIKENESQMKKINSLNRKYKKELNSERDRTKQLEIIENGKTSSVKFKEYKKENEMSKELLQDFIFMKNIVKHATIQGPCIKIGVLCRYVGHFNIGKSITYEISHYYPMKIIYMGIYIILCYVDN